MRVDVWALYIGSLAAVSCSTPAEELPAVRATPSASSPCLEPPRTIVVLDPSRPAIGSCAQVAWASQCEGSMSFEADVNPQGRVTALRFSGDASLGLRRCINRVLDGARVLNPAQCPDVDVTTIGGGIDWPLEGSTSVRWDGGRAVIPLLRECAVGVRGPTMD
jgi:hypothetical protein